MVKELKEKDEACRSSAMPAHVFHNANHELVRNQGFNGAYGAPSGYAPQYPSFSHGYNQHPYAWQQ
jgi:hypothetical protein